MRIDAILPEIAYSKSITFSERMILMNDTYRATRGCASVAPPRRPSVPY